MTKKYMLLNMILMAAGTIKIYICLEYTTYRKVSEYCRYNNNIYQNISATSNIYCAGYCATDFVGCSRFVYDEANRMCLVHTDNLMVETQTIQTHPGSSLYLREHTDCTVSGYNFDVSTNTCTKLYKKIKKTWENARDHCILDGGDLLTIATLEKWNFVASLINCKQKPYYIGLKNATWVDGEPFVNNFNLQPTEWNVGMSNGGICGRLKFDTSMFTVNHINCSLTRCYICELPMPI